MTRARVEKHVVPGFVVPERWKRISRGAPRGLDKWSRKCGIKVDLRTARPESKPVRYCS